MNRIQRPFGRRGGVLVLTMIIVVAVAAMTALSNDRMLAQTKLEQQNLYKQQAVYAAEAGAALAESFLKANATDLASLTIDLSNAASHPPSTWYNFMGQADAGKPPMFIGNCMVRWRLEPVRISSLTFDGTTPGSGSTLINDQANTSIIPPTGVVDNPGLYHFRIVASAYVLNNEYLASQGIPVASATPWANPSQARCIAQAQRVDQFNVTNLFRYVIFYAANGPTGDLEIHPGSALNIAGAVHCNGTIFAGGNSGYLTDFHAGCAQNGQVTIGSTTNKVVITGVNGILRSCKGALHSMVKSLLSSNPTARNYLLRPNDIPMPGSAKYGVTMNGIYNLNGDTTTSNKIVMNGNNLTYDKDTRSGLTVGGSDAYVRDGPNRQANPVQTLANLPELAGYPYEPQALGGTDGSRLGLSASGYARIDPTSGVTRFGAAVPQADPSGNAAYTADMPFFLFQNGSGGMVADVWPDQIGGSGGFLAANASTLNSPSRPWVHKPGDTAGGGVDLPWVFAPAVAGSSLAQTGVNPNQVAATYLPEMFSERWAILNPTVYTWTTPQKNPGGLEGRARPGYYLDVSLFGQPGKGRTGLTIRERGQQNVTWRWRRQNPLGTYTNVVVAAADLPPVYVAATHDCTGGGAAAANQNLARHYAAWLKSQYVVYLGAVTPTGGNLQPVDITDAFFDYQTGTGDIQQMVATHEEFLDRREANWYKTAKYDTTSTRKRNVLTLNLGAIQTFLSGGTSGTITLETLSSVYAGDTRRPNAVFSGLLYVQRTPRHQLDGSRYVNDCLWPRSYHPLLALPTVPPAAEFPSPAAGNKYYPVMGWVGTYRGPADGPDGARIGLTLPPVGNITPQYPAWAVYPTTKAVRVRNGSAINWGRSQDGVTPARLEGLTICTPDPLYLWGNYNTTVDPVAGGSTYPPCAILADSVTVLSSAWTFAQDTVDSQPAAVSTTYRVSYAINNMPTDIDNIRADASGGVHNAIRYLENWGGTTYSFIGSLVIMNRSRYGRGYVGGFYGVPTRSLSFNSDLLTLPGIPPETPKGVQVTRVISTINLTSR